MISSALLPGVIERGYMVWLNKSLAGVGVPTPTVESIPAGLSEYVLLSTGLPMVVVVPMPETVRTYELLSATLPIESTEVSELGEAETPPGVRARSPMLAVLTIAFGERMTPPGERVGEPSEVVTATETGEIVYELVTVGLPMLAVLGMPVVSSA
jgi:hypothetical protein